MQLLGWVLQHEHRMPVEHVFMHFRMQLLVFMESRIMINIFLCQHSSLSFSSGVFFSSTRGCKRV